MKKLLTVLSIAFSIAVIAPSCSSADESFEDIVLNSDLDQTAPTNGDENDDTNRPGGN
jgi:putative cell wall-binding protein